MCPYSASRAKSSSGFFDGQQANRIGRLEPDEAQLGWAATLFREASRQCHYFTTNSGKAERIVLLDYHLHSTCSADGISTIAQYCRRAAEQGFMEIGFCEHADFDPRDRSYGFFDYALFRRRIEAQRERYGHSLVIRAAVEVTYQACREGEIREFLKGKELDYVIGSVHLVEDGREWAMVSEEGRCERYFARRSMRQAYRPYFAEVRRAVESDLFDLIGHLDLAKRYGVRYYGPFELSLFAAEVREILQLAVERGVGLEINTSGLRQAPRETYPALEVLKWYRELGGEILTVGSDAHSVEDLGKGIAEALGLAREAGFEAITLFEKRKPRGLRIT
ncbi:MAG TPA: histidinol-phosphatase HisJ family protein [Anaerolineae bacterium]|nr:histidinol-phosphatase HisJ family protein [Anaerolineae bacterium]